MDICIISQTGVRDPHRLKLGLFGLGTYRNVNSSLSIGRALVGPVRAANQRDISRKPPTL